MTWFRKARKESPLALEGGTPAPKTKPPEKHPRRLETDGPQPLGPWAKQVVKISFLLVVCGLGWMIWQSNQNQKARSRNPNAPRAAASSPKNVSGTVKQFVSGLFSGKGSARAEVRPEDHLHLQGIIMSRRRPPIAMINMTAFEQGTKASLRLAARDYNVHCLDILSDQVTVRADDRDPVRLELKGREERLVR